MALKYVCDHCNKEVEKYIKIGIGMTMYCGKCWMDKKNWEKIHKDAVKDTRF